VIKFPGCGDALQCAMGYFIWGGFINSVARELAPRHPTPPPILPPAPAILDMHAPSPLAEAGGYRFSLLPTAFGVLLCGDFPAGDFPQRRRAGLEIKRASRFGSARPRRLPCRGHLTTLPATVEPVNASKSLAPPRDELVDCHRDC